MLKPVMAIVIYLVAAMSAGCMSHGPEEHRKHMSELRPGLVGAWLVEASRARGVGMNMLTFSSDGTFFRSGDTHPTLSGAHGAWKRVSDAEYHASYVAFRFDEKGNWVGINRNRIQIFVGPDGNTFTANLRSSNRDLKDKEVTTGQTRLSGRRIVVEPF